MRRLKGKAAFHFGKHTWQSGKMGSWTIYQTASRSSSQISLFLTNALNVVLGNSVEMAGATLQKEMFKDFYAEFADTGLAKASRSLIKRSRSPDNSEPLSLVLIWLSPLSVIGIFPLRNFSTMALSRSVRTYPRMMLLSQEKV